MLCQRFAFLGQDSSSNLAGHPTSKPPPGPYPLSPRGSFHHYPNPTTTTTTLIGHAKPLSPRLTHPHPPHSLNPSLSPTTSMKALHRRKSTTIVSPPTSLLDAPTYKLIHGGGGGGGGLGNAGSTTSLSNQQGYLRSEYPSDTSLIGERGSKFR